MSATWQSERTITDAEAEARERLALYALEREERMAEYRKAWEQKWARARFAAASGVSSLWRVK